MVATVGPLLVPLEAEFPADALQVLEALTEPVLDIRSGPVAGALGAEGKWVAAFPLVASGRRVGTLLVVREDAFGPEEEGVTQYVAAVLALQLLLEGRPELRDQAAEQVRTALGALSYSELEAIRHILQELGDTEGIVVASRVADRAGITRSVIVNALRKLESARVIQSRSLGMKGTYIKILNPLLREELERLRSAS